jgi:hypothetical protein
MTNAQPAQERMKGDEAKEVVPDSTCDAKSLENVTQGVLMGCSLCFQGISL